MSEDLIDIGNQSGFNPTTGQVIDLTTTQPDAEIGAVSDGLIVETDDGDEIEVSGAELAEFVGAKKKRKGVVARVRENREERQEDRQERRADRKEDRQERRAERRGDDGDDDSGGYWEQYSYNFTGSNSGGATASVTSTKSIGSRFIAEKISLQGSAGGSLFRSLKVGDDYVLDYPDGAAVENFAVNGYMLGAIEGREFPANSTATLVIDSVPASGLVRALVSGRRWRTKPRCN
ncbi:hypothetical protein L6R46_04360 [Myxococcota bacterium]|nr:hypothetical protein [Myxococcota bacterium]